MEYIGIWYKNVGKYGRVYSAEYPEDEQFSGWYGPVMVPTKLVDALLRLNDIVGGADQVIQKRSEL